MKPADTFLLFRFEKDILFQDLFNLSGISEEEFYRLIYLFKCAGIVTLEEEVSHEHIVAHKPPRKPVTPQYVTATVPATMREDLHPSMPAPASVAAAAPAVATGVSSAPSAELKAAVDKPAAVATPVSGQPAAKPAETAQYYFKLAHQSFKNKNYWAAVEYCKKALEHKKDVSTYVLMGNAFATHPNFRHEAMNAYKEALAIDHENPMIHRDMGDLYFKTGNLALARGKYQEVLDLDPTDEHAIKLLEAVNAKMKK